MNTTNIAIFCSKNFYEFINEQIQTKVTQDDFFISLTHYEDIPIFFQKNFKKRYPGKIRDLKHSDNIRNYFHVTSKYDLFWIVENPDDDIIFSIRDIAVWLRWFRFETPFLVSAFRDECDLLKIFYPTDGSKNQHDAMHFLRLPFEIESIVQSIEKAKSHLAKNPVNLPYVDKYCVIINHGINSMCCINTSNPSDTDLNEKVIKTIDTKPLELPILIIDNQQGDLDEYEKIIDRASLDFYKEQQISIIVHKKLITENCLESKETMDNCIKEMREEYVDLQCILLDWILRKKDNPTPKFLELFKEYFPNTPVYILTKNTTGYDIVEQCDTDKYKDYFSKDELKNRTRDVLNKIVCDYNKRRTAPFWNAFKNYVIDTHDAWHTPGHSRGESFRASDYLKEFYDFWSENTFAGDLSVSVDKLGSLLDSSKFIGEAQDKAAQTFGANHTFFATNGSSTSNKVMLQSILKPDDVVILDRNCHKSMHYGCIQAQLRVKYLKSEYCPELGIFAPPSTEEIKTALANTPEAKALILTGCTYDGLLINMKDLKKIVDEHNKGKKTKLKLFIDEAWFAYSGFHHRYKDYSAIKNKADYITHSTHKVLSAFSQASYMHINDPDFDKEDLDKEDYFREIMYIYTSTSPQYQMIASLDVASMQMEMEGYQIVQKAIKIAEGFKKQVNSTLKHIKVLALEDIKKEFEKIKEIDKKGDYEPVILDKNLGHDPLKITLDVRNSKESVKDILKTIREKANIEIEKDTLATITILFTIGATYEKATRLYRILKNIDDKGPADDKKKKQLIDDRKVIKKQKFSEKRDIVKLSDYFYGKCEPMDLSNIKKGKNLKSARLVLPYPPGIPVLVPGQIITPDIVEYLKGEVKKGTDIHGFSHHSGDKPEDKKLYVVVEPKSNNTIQKQE